MIDYRKSESFSSEYANNIQIESTAWDVRLNFGQVDQSVSPDTVTQHTGITMPWSQAKVLMYFLRLHLTMHELQNGHVAVPKNIIVPMPAADKEKFFPNADEFHEAMSKQYAEFMAANPEAAPDKPAKK